MATRESIQGRPFLGLLGATAGLVGLCFLWPVFTASETSSTLPLHQDEERSPSEMVGGESAIDVDEEVDGSSNQRLSLPPTAETSSDPAAQVTLAQRSLEDEWRAEVESLSVEQLDGLAGALREEIQSASDAWFGAALEVGPYEIVGTGTRQSLDSWDHSVVMRIQMPGPRTDGQNWATEGKIRKAVLPESMFPHVYRLHEKAAWIQRRADELRIVAHRMKHSKVR